MPEHKFKEDVLNILRLLSLKGDLNQRDLSASLNISLGKTNYLIKSLIKKNLIKTKNFSTKKDKLGKVRYILSKKGIKQKVHLTYHFLKKKELEYMYIKEEWDKLSRQMEAEGKSLDDFSGVSLGGKIEGDSEK
ncbi:MAG: MarR family EPS-associated transcriptional regulator [Candidatus Omnitrophica bacterium]|nr:MarR family EPS-associated transcriptional regulator [Candidatus Omnitrophota bacterium]